MTLCSTITWPHCNIHLMKKASKTFLLCSLKENEDSYNTLLSTTILLCFYILYWTIEHFRRLIIRACTADTAPNAYKLPIIEPENSSFFRSFHFISSKEMHFISFSNILDSSCGQRFLLFFYIFKVIKTGITLGNPHVLRRGPGIIRRRVLKWP